MTSKHTMSGVKPFDLSNLLKHAFYSGAGYTDKYKVSEADVQRWLAYNPEGLKPYERICAALAPSDAEPDADEAAIDALRHKAFRSNSEADRQAYFDAVSKWFQHRHYRRMAHPDSSSEAVREALVRVRNFAELMMHGEVSYLNAILDTIRAALNAEVKK